MKMSTSAKTVWCALFIGLSCNLFCANIYSQELEIEIRQLPENKHRFEISGRIKGRNDSGIKNWVFLDSYSDADNLAKRVTGLTLADNSGNVISAKQFAPGEFVAERPAARFNYHVDLSEIDKPTSAAHVSWITGSYGFLMLNDLLPQLNAEAGPAAITLQLNPGWSISTSEQRITQNSFSVSDPVSGVFLIGNGWRELRKKVGGSELSVAINGDWQFEDVRALEMAGSIFAEYERLLGKPAYEAKVFISPFPEMSGFDRWRAETKGGNVLIVSSKTTFDSQALQRLHEQLRHELLHLWIPNSLNLTGDYAWFYEGFVVYQALKSGVWLGQIRFTDFLDTLNRAKDLNERRENRTPLLEISKNRWSEVGSSVYARGMLVGFLCDLALLRSSRNKSDISDLFTRLLTNNGKSSEPEKAADSLINLFSGYPELVRVTGDHLISDKDIYWTGHLAETGLEIDQASGTGKIVIRSKLNGREKALLNKLGYNRWRKL
ncbi:MAG: hypothetical protein R2681_14175 [Pyrinomonadaceae bacterium]